MREKIGLLYRVSSKPQESDGGSLDVQKTIGRKISKQLNLDFVEFNEGVQSSYNVEVNLRPKLVELLDEIQKKDGIRKVWVFNTDRLGRYSKSWYSILKVFLDYGVQIYIGEHCDKPYDLTNSVDRLTIGILSLISQYDNELRRLRSIIGKRNSLKNGNTYLGSTIPFGYSVKNKKLIINNQEKPFIEEIFDMYDKGTSTRDIKIYLDRQMDIKPRRSVYGWNLGTIQNMLRNTLYIGEQTWEWKEKLPNGETQTVETIKIKTPTIIDKNTFKRVNEKMDLRIRDFKNDKGETPLLKGLLKCKSCKLLLSHRYRQTNHYYGRCKEYNWKKNFNSNSCSIQKSLRIEETDIKVLDTVIETVKNSTKIREDYKIKNLTPKWENEKKLSKQTKTIQKYLREKKRELENLENEIVQIEFEIRTGQTTNSTGKKLQNKFNEKIEIINKDIENLNSELELLSNSNGWINWLEKMSSDIDKIKKSNQKVQKNFLNENIKEIMVEFDSKTNSHKLDIRFKFPIVGDYFEYDKNKSRDDKGFKKYVMYEGSKLTTIEIPLTKYKRKKNGKNRELLNSEIIRLREKEGLTLQNICDELNTKKLYSPRNKKWDKPKLSSYYTRLKEEIPKK